MGGIGLGQGIPQVFHLPGVPGGAHPDMLVDRVGVFLRRLAAVVLMCMPLALQKGIPSDVSATRRSAAGPGRR